MKVLIAYDGSRSSDEALADLASAGLPQTAEAKIITVAEQWLAHLHHSETESAMRTRKVEGDGAPEGSADLAKGLDEASALASHAMETVGRQFPDWDLSVSVVPGSPAREILAESESMDADLIVLGSQGRSAVGRLLLGSISQKVLAEASCSVRIGRAGPERSQDDTIVVGFDGSPGSYAAVEAIATRKWRGDCSIVLVTAMDALVPTAIGRFIPPVVKWVEEETRVEHELIRKLADEAFRRLDGAGCGVDLLVRNRNPRQVIVEEAERLGANCIFLGANSYGSSIERYFIGSTSTAIAARSRCSVEVVR